MDKLLNRLTYESFPKKRLPNIGTQTPQMYYTNLMVSLLLKMCRYGFTLLPISPFFSFLVFIPSHRSIILLWRALVEKERLASQLEFIPHWQFMMQPTCMFSTMALRMFKSQHLVLGA